MKNTFHIKYISDWDNKNKSLKIEEGIVKDASQIHWDFECKKYFINRRDPDFTQYTFISQNYIIVLYDESEEYSPSFHHPQNLIVYNIKKEIIKIIKPPEPIIRKFKELPFTQFGHIETFNKVQYLELYVGEWNDEEVTHSEIRYLNLETFDFHPTNYEIRDTFGRNKAVKYIKYGM
jgi:hypothetical protein